eukprot:TRINITY_DN3375_c0_g1_i1.p1 TRINITY_DN3375_c0_g1~~TRINITY_DN3375_c0_g1_i1.p1  ORF type:complete len:190 (+),score=40.17 TRINITY_DN3375_c0_g1_i1:50-571(+)
MSKEKLPCILREAKQEDVETILSLIKDLAEYEKEPHEVSNTAENLLKDGFGEQPLFYVILAESPSVGEEKPIVYGFALWFFVYSTWKGRCLFLEDIYVKPEYRGKGVGLKLFLKCAQESKKHNCKRFQWMVLDWNKPSIDFYISQGANQTKSWLPFRMDDSEVDSLLKKNNLI